MDEERIEKKPDIMTVILLEVVDINTKITNYEYRIKAIENDLDGLKEQQKILMKKGFIRKLFGG